MGKLDLKKNLLESLWGLEIEIPVWAIAGNKKFTITIPIYIITSTFCDSQQKLFGAKFRDTQHLY